MGAYKGTVATAVAATGLANKQGLGVIDARVKQAFDTYATTGAETTGSTIAMGPILPQGALIRNVEMIMSAITGGASISVGDSASASRYIAATVTSSAGRFQCTLVAGVAYVIGTNTGDNQILLTTSGGTLQAGQTIQTIITYVFD